MTLVAGNKKKAKLVKKFNGRSSSIKSSLKKITGTELRLDVVRAWMLRCHNCIYCDIELYPDKYSIDHMVPVSRNGPDSFGNLVFCCKSCNLAKGSLTYAEYRDLRFQLQFFSPEAQKNIMD